MNKVILMGRLKADPETRESSRGGQSVTKFQLAVPDKLKPKDQTKVYWAFVVGFGKLGEIMQKYLTKGSQILVEGRLSRTSWQKDGVTQYRDEVIADSFEFCGGKVDANTEADPDIPF
jgi:single-strand DNA-binding protein